MRRLRTLSYLECPHMIRKTVLAHTSKHRWWGKQDNPWLPLKYFFFTNCKHTFFLVKMLYDSIFAALPVILRHKESLKARVTSNSTMMSPDIPEPLCPNTKAQVELITLPTAPKWNGAIVVDTAESLKCTIKSSPCQCY